MKSILNCFLAFFLLSAHSFFSQQSLKNIAGTKVWIGGEFMVPASDKGFFIFGSSDAGTFWGGTTVIKNLIIRCDSSGDIKWNNAYVFDTSSVFYDSEFVDAAVCHDQSIIAAGVMTVNSVVRGFCAKLTSTGGVEWCMNLTDTAGRSLLPYSVIQSRDSGFALCGTTAKSEKMFIARLSQSGSLVSCAVLNELGNSRSFATAIIETKDSGLVITGGLDYALPFLLKTDKFGNVLWAKKYAMPHTVSYGTDLLEDDNGYSIAVSASKPYLIKTNIGGIMTNSTRYETYFELSDKHERELRMRKTKGNGYLLSLKVSSVSITNYAIVTDSAGSPLWSWTSAFEKADVIQTKNSNFVVMLNPSSAIPKMEMPLFDYDIGLIIMDSTGMSTTTCNAKQTLSLSPVTYGAFNFSVTALSGGFLTPSPYTYSALQLNSKEGCLSLPIGLGENVEELIRVFPVPSSGEIVITAPDYPFNNLKIIITDALGRQVRNEELASGTSEERRIKNLQAGVYYYRISSSSGPVKTGKIIISR